MSNLQFKSVAEASTAFASGSITPQEFQQFVVEWEKQKDILLAQAQTQLAREQQKSSPDAAIQRWIALNPPKPFVTRYYCDADGCPGHDLPLSKEVTSGVSFDGQITDNTIMLERAVLWDVSLDDLSPIYQWVEATFMAASCPDAKILVKDYSYKEGKRGINIYFGGTEMENKYREKGAARKAKKALPAPVDSADQGTQTSSQDDSDMPPA